MQIVHNRRQPHEAAALLWPSLAAEHGGMDMKLALGRAIRQRRNAAGLTQMQVAEAAGTDQASLSRIERGKEEPPNDKLEQIARALGTRVSTLWAEAEGLAQPMDRATTYETLGVRYVPLISWVEAGAWSEAVDPYARGTGEEMVPTGAKVSRRAYALRVHGNSMTNPTGINSYPEGTKIIVDPAVDVSSGQLVIVRLENENAATFKRYVEESGKKLLLPLNPQYPTIVLDRDANFCGVVVAQAERIIDE